MWDLYNSLNVTKFKETYKNFLLKSLKRLLFDPSVYATEQVLIRHPRIIFIGNIRRRERGGVTRRKVLMVLI